VLEHKHCEVHSTRANLEQNCTNYYKIFAMLTNSPHWNAINEQLLSVIRIDALQGAELGSGRVYGKRAS
jgi:hypothetical protein